jgi:hypothetical protein
MRMSSSGYFSAALILATAGCASAPLDRKENVELAGRPRLFRTVHLIFDEDVEQFGTQEEWRAEIQTVFRDLRVCTAVVESESPRADLEMHVGFRTKDVGSKVDTQGAILDFLAWSTIPLLPLWIGDVNIDSGLEADVTVKFPENGKVIVHKSVPSAKVKTAHLDRHAFISWPTAGALLLPPFVFGSPDVPRLQKTIASQVRMETACELASVVKDMDMTDELISNLAVKLDKGKWYLHYTPTKDLLYFFYWVETLDGLKIRTPGSFGKKELLHPKDIEPIALGEFPAGDPAAPLLVHIKAQGNQSGHQQRTYSLYIPLPEDGSEL